MLRTKPSRRDFLKSTGVLIVSFSLPSLSKTSFAQSGTPANTGTKTVALDDVDAFLAIDSSGGVTLYSGKVDLGTGIGTALTQIVAEELDVPLAGIQVVEGDTALTPAQGKTWGSLSIQNGGVQIRQAAATARLALLQEAAKRLGAPVEDLMVEQGTVRSRSGGKQITYGELIGGKTFSLNLDKQAPLKDPATYKIVGQPVPRFDIPGKMTGQFTYMQDFKVPGMLHGRVVRPAAIGATLLSVDENSVKDVPGLVKVVRQGNFLGVVAESEWGAIRASQKLKASWSNWEGLPEQSKLWEHVRATKVNKDDVTSNVGSAEQALQQAAKRLSATYNFAIHTHASMGPSCAVAEIKEGKLTCWSSSQATHDLRQQLAAMLSMPDADVRAIYLEGSGCYGRNGHEDAAADAVLLARAVERPVRVQWMRADEHGWDPKGPPTLMDLQAGLDANGNVIAWYSQLYVPEGATGNVKLVAAELAGLPHETGMVPGNLIQNTAIPYAFPNVRTVAHRLAETPLRPSWIRAPGRMQNTFCNESFMDELAAAVGADPLEFRLRYLNDPRGVELLKRLASFAQWQSRALSGQSSSGRSLPKRDSGDIATGRGLTYIKYELARTYVGAVADVEVNRKSGEIRVKHFAVVQDCGQIVNPDGVKNQIEGNVTQTVSRVLKEEVTFDRSRVTSLNWASYPILTFPEIPDVDIELIDRPSEKPWGAGEPSAAVVPSAISNAVFDAVGVRLRSVPFTSAKVLAAMQST
ncbi:MAG TPA: molybdopterin cofactor-binding domain-containing protein [Terriglobales bacterium]|nr:molybdopterin cofactor-binding domain-containing protein [Terriglobales bacterium]